MPYQTTTPGSTLLMNHKQQLRCSKRSRRIFDRSLWRLKRMFKISKHREELSSPSQSSDAGSRKVSYVKPAEVAGQKHCRYSLDFHRPQQAFHGNLETLSKIRYPEGIAVDTGSSVYSSDHVLLSDPTSTCNTPGSVCNTSYGSIQSLTASIHYIHSDSDSDWSTTQESLFQTLQPVNLSKPLPSIPLQYSGPLPPIPTRLEYCSCSQCLQLSRTSSTPSQSRLSSSSSSHVQSTITTTFENDVNASMNSTQTLATMVLAHNEHTATFLKHILTQRYAYPDELQHQLDELLPAVSSVAERSYRLGLALEYYDHAYNYDYYYEADDDYDADDELPPTVSPTLLNDSIATSRQEEHVLEPACTYPRSAAIPVQASSLTLRLRRMKLAWCWQVKNVQMWALGCIVVEATAMRWSLFDLLPWIIYFGCVEKCIEAAERLVLEASELEAT